eukprot:RCo014309
MVIEVEQKFIFKAGLQLALQTSGARLVKTLRLRDVYYDYCEGEPARRFRLSRTDEWLRERNGTWEFKRALPKAGQGADVVTQYKELTREEDILLALNLNAPPDGPKRSFEALLQEAGLSPLVVIDCERSSYELDHMTVDLDVTTDGYRLCEIEAVVQTEQEIPVAKRRIAEVATRLGIHSAEFVPGKVLASLVKNRPELLSLLVADGRVPSSALSRLRDWAGKQNEGP